MLATWAGYYGEWELGEKITLDTVSKRVIVHPGTTNLDIRSEVYSALKRMYLASPDLMIYDFPIRTVGGDPTVQGQFAGDLYFMQNGWRLEVSFSETAIAGALFSDDFDTPYLSRGGQPQYAAQVSSLVNLVTTTETVVNDAALAPIEVTTEFIRKLLANRVEISGDNAVTTIYDDDGVTPVHVFDHSDERNRSPR